VGQIDRDFNKRFAAARRVAIARDFMHLNPEQREAVLKTEGPLLILAGAGSGKTTVLINRIANILQYGRGSDSDETPDFVTDDDLEALELYAATGDDSLRERARSLSIVDPCPPWRVIAITFTNKAAGELKSRLEDMLGAVSAREVWAMTFHSACVRMLRRDADRLGYGTNFVIYDTADSQSVLKRIIRDFGGDEKQFTPKLVHGRISHAKNEGIESREYAQEAEKGFDHTKKFIARCFAEYEKRCRAANAFDFDDLILQTVRLLRENEDVRLYYQQRFKYVLVDEYQDTNSIQYRLASLITNSDRNICVVGDDDQSIYKFRGATVENILGFEKQFKGTYVVRLERNYRSTSPILEAANDVISHNKSRHRKRLWTDTGSDVLPELVIREDERDEARFVAETIIDGVAAGSVSWRDHVVLYRMNAQSQTFEYEFKRHNIPYKIYGGTGFFDRAEVKDVIAYLCVIANPADDAHLLRIINTPARGIGDTTVDLLADTAAEAGVSIYDVIKNAEEHVILPRAMEKLGRFRALIEDLSECAAAKPLDEFYDELIEKTGLIRALEAKKNDENLTRIENIREVKSTVITFMRENPEGNLGDLLEQYALYTDLDRDTGAPDHVAVMTMHSAKGLEFDTVFIVGAEDGIFPGQRTIGEPEEMEEERRLCYVAMTRAKSKLFFVSTKRRMLFGRTTNNRTSSFVEEIDASHITRPKKTSIYAAFGPDYETVRDDWFDASRSTRGFARSRFSHEQQPFHPENRPPERRTPNQPKKTASAQLDVAKQDFKVGDSVRHKAFGTGIVKAATPTGSPIGSDILLEIEFDNVGTKRLMRNSVNAYMTKI